MILRFWFDAVSMLGLQVTLLPYKYASYCDVVHAPHAGPESSQPTRLQTNQVSPRACSESIRVGDRLRAVLDGFSSSKQPSCCGLEPEDQTLCSFSAHTPQRRRLQK
ncbi:hypothetical protein R3P38DRAFT_2978749 [Favolaschia claudopus]|uniref:Secreted protein n=1 Tax=Favolaschia claudopus TaxID=2862362 RepID=A0AAW0B0L0_9AGAR